MTQKMPPNVDIKMPAVKIGKGLTAQFSYRDRRVNCEWDPSVPRQPMSRQMRQRYMQAQRLFISEVANAMGGPVALIGLNGAELIAPDTRH
jgi:hypothetical protein